ncbi:MAG: DUF3311 domain-containing protein [Thaumarchaeota archaeon]|nr:DUF3311 domain-containing protein [Nitrososphaerota archaeon]
MHVRKRHVMLALLIAVPAVLGLWVPIYNRDAPRFYGIPFFYWFQTFWLVASAGFYMAFARMKEGRN